MQSGAPVTQSVTPAALAGAERLQAAVKMQQAQKRAERQESALRRAGALSNGALNANGSSVGRLESLLGVLGSQIDDQSLAKDVVARALRRRSLALDDSERPLRLLFAGPSGVGKTAMAAAVCEALCGACIPDRNFKRWNLSEFSHPSKFNRLTGGDPNYVGYREGGELTNFIREAEERRAKKITGVEHTSCVVLLDEVDRAAFGLLTF